MAINVTEEMIGDVLVVGPEGRLDGNTSKDFESTLENAIDSGCGRILVDFSSLDYISSLGLRVILATAKRLKKEQGKVALCQLNDNIRQAFEISGFNAILDIEDSREDALAAFF